jgi:uncharacterized protein (TIGR00251 family)
MPAARPASHAVTAIDVVVKPRSHVERIVVSAEGLVTVAVAAPPVEGAANDRVVKLIARALRLPPSALSIVKGASSRRKVVAVGGLERGAALERLRAAGPQ